MEEIQELPEQQKACPHGKVAGALVLCSRPPEETGTLPVWKCSTSERIIVTPYWCQNRCKLNGGEGHL